MRDRTVIGAYFLSSFLISPTFLGLIAPKTKTPRVIHLVVEPKVPENQPNPDRSGKGTPDSGKPVKNPTTVSVSELMSTPSRAIRPLGLDVSRKLARSAVKVALENNGTNVIVIDVSEQSAEFDFFVIACGSSRRQLHAISEQIDDVLQKDLGDLRLGIEGYQESSWIVLDYGNVVMHLFDEETREFYDLESLWADGKVIHPAELGLAEDGSELNTTDQSSN